MGGFGMMIAKSVLSYLMFRTTRTITKAGVDALGELGAAQRLSRCPRCGNIEVEADICSRCNSKMHKMYRDYPQQGIRLVDDSLLYDED